MAAEGIRTRLVQWAEETLGFDVRALRMERLVAAADEEERRLGSGEALLRALAAGEPRLVAALVAAVTVGETYFYRQREHFDLLAQWPRAGRGTLLAWSAGCSTGEETYSLAAALRRCTGLERPALSVWGTDISEAALATAREARYGRWSWRDTGAQAAQLLQAQALEAGTRNCVHFARHNLLQPPVFDGATGERFDLVFCRNVLVYFHPLAAARALTAIADAMRPGGWLVLGNTDLGGAPAGFRRIGSPALCVYAKDAAQGAGAAWTTLAPPPPPRQRLVPPPPELAVPVIPVPEGPVAWHRRVLGLIEDGQTADALRELRRLVQCHPDYLPGRFEEALALRRAGHGPEAAAGLRGLMALVQGRPLHETVDGPESLSLEFYVNSAQSFLASLGGGI